MPTLRRFSTPILFAAISIWVIASYDWARRWLLSGTFLLTLIILLGSSIDRRILPFIHAWTLIASLNLVYSVAATSWLLYAVFTAVCYPTILFTSIFQFDHVANLVRGKLRVFLAHIQFVNDKIAYFNLPALEIDTDVDGLMVIRGITIFLSTLEIHVHGVEIGIKLSDDMELAIQVDKITISLFRRIEVSDVYANLKGGQYEMTFHQLEGRTKGINGTAMMDSDTPLLKAAAASGTTALGRQKVSMQEEMTDGKRMTDSSAKDGIQSITRLSPTDEEASRQYDEALNHIQDTSSINQARRDLRQHARTRHIDESSLDESDENEMRAAICSRLHNEPTVPHPPQRSIRVTTLQNLTPPFVRRFLHRLPMLLRFLLAPLSYFHPVSIASITATGSGKWIKEMLGQEVFKEYSESDAELRRLEQAVSIWLSEANFAVEVAQVAGLAQVPFSTGFDIFCSLGFGDMIAYRTVPEKVTLRQVIRLGGADATFTVPTFLLPHHEHILPDPPTQEALENLTQQITTADGKPKTVQAERNLEQARNDVANVRMSVHASLPACLDQELLNFVAALVKATKVVEMEKEPSVMDEQVDGIKDFARNVRQATKDGVKKVVVDGVVNDRWIARLVGKVTRRLETAAGDVGYSGNIPVLLEPYRPAKGVRLGSKLLA